MLLRQQRIRSYCLLYSHRRSGNQKTNTSKTVFSTSFLGGFCTKQTLCRLSNNILLWTDSAGWNNPEDPGYLLAHLHDAMLLQRTDLNAGASLFVSQPPLKPERKRVRP